MAAELPGTPRTNALAELQALVARIYGPEGCLWAQQQTHASLRRYVLEEAAEVVQALTALGPVPLPDACTEETVSPQLAHHLREELGDLLFQVLVHAWLSEREGLFTLHEVLEALRAKLVRRHPHVFAGSTAMTLAEVEEIWAEVKRQERMGLHA